MEWTDAFGVVYTGQTMIPVTTTPPLATLCTLIRFSFTPFIAWSFPFWHAAVLWCNTFPPMRLLLYFTVITRKSHAHRQTKSHTMMQASHLAVLRTLAPRAVTSPSC